MHETLVRQLLPSIRCLAQGFGGFNGWPAPALVEREGEKRPDANNDKPFLMRELPGMQCCKRPDEGLAAKQVYKQHVALSTVAESCYMHTMQR